MGGDAIVTALALWSPKYMPISGPKTRGVRLCGLEVTWGSVERNQMVEIL